MRDATSDRVRPGVSTSAVDGAWGDEASSLLCFRKYHVSLVAPIATRDALFASSRPRNSEEAQNAPIDSCVTGDHSLGGHFFHGLGRSSSDNLQGIFTVHFFLDGRSLGLRATVEVASELRFGEKARRVLSEEVIKSHTKVVFLVAVDTVCSCQHKSISLIAWRGHDGRVGASRKRLDKLGRRIRTEKGDAGNIGEQVVRA